MDKINGLNAIVSILRSQVSKNSGKTGKSPSGAHKAASSQTKTKLSAQELDSLISNKIKKLNPDEENYHGHSVRIIIESILVWEFGEEIVTDPEFDALVSKVTRKIEMSEPLRNLYSQYFTAI